MSIENLKVSILKSLIQLEKMISESGKEGLYFEKEILLLQREYADSIRVVVESSKEFLKDTASRKILSWVYSVEEIVNQVYIDSSVRELLLNEISYVDSKLKKLVYESENIGGGVY